MYTQKLLYTLFLFIVLLAGCGLETKTLTEFYENDLADVTKIQILDGSTGHSKIITDKKVMNEFLDEIKDIQFIPEENQEDRTGFLYSITLYQDEEMTFSFTLNEVNDHYYYTEPDINPVVDKFYKNLKNVDNQPSNINKIETKAQVAEGDFIYRLVTEKAAYSENEPIKIYAELEYTGDKEKIKIAHAASPFYFPMVETTRNYEIGYGMEQPLLSTVIFKGKPLRTEYKVNGGYGSQDKKEYIEFMKQIMNQKFPDGHYVVNGIADFVVLDNEEIEQKKEYKIEAQVEFRVKNSN